jgi:hypothetical protein
MEQSTPAPQGHDDVLTKEAFDEDDRGVDPLECGMDPAEGWSASHRYGTPAIEQVTDRPLTERGVRGYYCEMRMGVQWPTSRS